jgi:hypothetical protein
MEFENISQAKIIEFVNSMPLGYYKNLVPNEIVKNKSGEIIILSGKKSKFETVINFWLCVQSWYSDGSENLGEELCFDNLTAYDAWQNDGNRVGKCILATNEETVLFNQKVSFHFKKIVPSGYLVMSSKWNNLKLLFTDESNYYVYYFWTGN